VPRRAKDRMVYVDRVSGSFMDGVVKVNDIGSQLSSVKAPMGKRCAQKGCRQYFHFHGSSLESDFFLYFLNL
jgi:hypothetical protein